MLLATILLTVTLSLPQVVLGPSSTVPDSPTLLFGNYLYTSAGTTYIISDTLHPVLFPGPAFDTCGAWLMGAYQDGPTVRGWYHAETECGLAYNFQTHKSIAYAESYDGGLTWDKPGYPDNQIITAPGYIPDALYDDEGDFSVVVNGEYFYLYFLTSRDHRTHLARSLIASGGGPGTWYKYYQGDFTEPGLGGESDPMAWQWEFQTPWVAWNDYLQKYIAFNRRYGGWALSTSEDGIHWTGLDCVIISDAGTVPNMPLRLVDYMSFVGSGQAVDLYYLEIAPREGYDRRYLMRQGVTFEVGPGCVTQEASVLVLPRLWWEE